MKRLLIRLAVILGAVLFGFLVGVQWHSWWQRLDGPLRVKAHYSNCYFARVAISSYMMDKKVLPKTLDDCLSSDYIGQQYIHALKHECLTRYIPLVDSEAYCGYVLIVEANPKHWDETYVLVSFYEKKNGEWATVYDDIYIRPGEKHV